MAHIAEEFGRFALNLKFEDIPSHVVSSVKDHILDTVGVTLAAYKQESTSIVLDYVRNTQGRSESTIIGFGDKVPAANAALANGIMAHGLEYNDYYYHGGGHPGPIIIPPALALAEREAAHGKALIMAVLVGYEVAIRLGWVMRQAGAGERGFHLTATCGVFGATTAAGRIVGLNTDQMANALGLTGSQAGAIWHRAWELSESDHSYRKRFHAGWAAHSAVVATELVKRGYTGSRGVFERPKGFFQAFGGIKTEGEVGERIRRTLIDNLGMTFELPRVSYKMWPGCGTYIAAQEASANLMRQYKITLDEIDEVTVAMGAGRLWEENLAPICYDPPSETVAQFSPNCMVAAALVHGAPRADMLSVESMKDSKIRSLMPKIRFVVNEQAGIDFPLFAPAIVSVKLTNGRVYTERRTAVKGDYPLLPTKEELREKFNLLAIPVVSNKASKKIIDMVDNLDKLGNVGDLTQLMHKV